MGPVGRKPNKPTLALLDDMVEQTLRSLVVAVAAPKGATDTKEERDALLAEHEHKLVHYRMILRDVLRQAAALGEQAVLEEMDKLGVERALLEVVVDRRRA